MAEAVQNKKMKLDISTNEKDVLSALIADKKLAATFISEMKHEFFNNTNVSSVFKFVKAYWNKYDSVPTKQQVIDMCEKIMRGNADDRVTQSVYPMLDIIYYREPFNDHEIEYVKSELTHFVQRSKLYEAFQESVSEIDDPLKYEEIHDRMTKAVLWNTDDDLGLSIKEVKRRYDAIEEIEEAKIPSPWASLNAEIGGGFAAKQLSGFAACSSVGKSIALQQCAFYAWHVLKKNVVYVTMELSQEVVSMRLDSHFLKIGLTDLISKREKVEDAYRYATNLGHDLVIREFPDGSTTAKNIMSFLRKLKLYRGFSPDLLIIDSPDNMIPNSGKKTSLYTDGGDVWQQSRGLAQTLEIPALVASQFNRSAFGLPIEELSEFYLSDSSKKMFAVDTLIALGGTKAQMEQGEIYFKNLKARSGKKNAIIPMTIEYPFFTLTEQGYSSDS